MPVGIGILGTVSENTPSLAVGLSFLGRFGAGGIVQPATTMLIVTSSDRLIDTITGLALCVRLGGSINWIRDILQRSHQQVGGYSTR